MTVLANAAPVSQRRPNRPSSACCDSTAAPVLTWWSVTGLHTHTHTRMNSKSISGRSGVLLS